MGGQAVGGVGGGPGADDAVKIPVELTRDELAELIDQYHTAPCGLLSSTPDGVVLRVNDTFLNWTGYTPDEIIGRPFQELLTDGSRLLYESRLVPSLRRSKEVREIALVLHCAGRETLPVLANSALRAAAGDHPMIIRTAVFDATGRQDHERELLAARRSAEQSDARLAVLQESSVTFGEARSTDALSALLAETVRGALDATVATMMILDRYTGELQAVGATYPLGSTAAIDSDRPEATAVRTGSVITIPTTLEAPPEIGAALRAAGLEGVSVVPLFDEHQPFGALACFFARRRDLDEHELDLLTALTRLAAQALQRIRLQEQTEFQALHDQLTGLANRQLLQYRLTQALNRAARHRRSLAVIFLDLDGFKSINDELGHLVGDVVLEQVSERLLASVRAGDTAARFGGDEFVVLCEDTDTAAAAVVARRIRSEVRRPLDGAAAEFSLTASAGVAVYIPAGGPVPAPKAVLRRADAAMYRSKAAGKDRDTVVEI